MHKIVFCADIKQMYRQIKLKKEQQCLQKVLWRSNLKEPVGIYESTTITFGTTVGAHLAICCTVELGQECKKACQMYS